MFALGVYVFCQHRLNLDSLLMKQNKPDPAILLYSTTMPHTISYMYYSENDNGIKDWNSLPLSVRNLESKQKFKSEVKKVLFLELENAHNHEFVM